MNIAANTAMNTDDIPPAPTLRPSPPNTSNTFNNNADLQHSYQSTPPLHGYSNNQLLQITHLEHIDPSYIHKNAALNNHLLTVVPSEYEINNASLQTNPNNSFQNNPNNNSILRKISDSEHGRKYTSSSDPSTLQTSYQSIPPPPPPLPTNTLTNLNTTNYPQSVLSTEFGDGDKLGTWNYAYSYASSTIAVRSRFNDIDDHKTTDTTLMIKRPSLTSELQQKLRTFCFCLISILISVYFVI